MSDLNTKFQYSVGNLLLAVSCFDFCIVCVKFVLRTRETLDYIYMAAIVGTSSGAAVGALLKGIRGAVLGGLIVGGISCLLCLLAGIPFVLYWFWRGIP